MTGGPPPYPAELYPGCPCYACDRQTWPLLPGTTIRHRARMSLCPTCGNKRCPGAADHRNACTSSNEPGQPGSLYRPLLRTDGCPAHNTPADAPWNRCQLDPNHKPPHRDYFDREW